MSRLMFIPESDAPRSLNRCDAIGVGVNQRWSGQLHIGGPTVRPVSTRSRSRAVIILGLILGLVLFSSVSLAQVAASSTPAGDGSTGSGVSDADVPSHIAERHASPVTSLPAPSPTEEETGTPIEGVVSPVESRTNPMPREPRVIVVPSDGVPSDGVPSDGVANDSVTIEKEKRSEPLSGDARDAAHPRGESGGTEVERDARDGVTEEASADSARDRGDVREHGLRQPTGRDAEVKHARSEAELRPRPADPHTSNGGANRPAVTPAMAPSRDHDPRGARAMDSWLAAETLSVKLEESRGGSGSPALRGLKRELLGSYREQAKQRRIRTLLNEYRERREVHRRRGDRRSHRLDFDRSTQKSYQLYKGGNRISRADEPDIFDFWRFVFSGAQVADDSATARDAFRALTECFGEDPRFDGFLDDRRREMIRSEEAHAE